MQVNLIYWKSGAAVHRYSLGSLSWKVLENSHKNIRGRVLFSKVTAEMAWIFTKKWLCHECFPVSFPKIFRIVIFAQQPLMLLLKNVFHPKKPFVFYPRMVKLLTNHLTKVWKNNQLREWQKYELLFLI